MEAAGFPFGRFRAGAPARILVCQSAMAQSVFARAGNGPNSSDAVLRLHEARRFNKFCYAPSCSPQSHLVLL